MVVPMHRLVFIDLVLAILIDNMAFGEVGLLPIEACDHL
jgi:hypothetical protein